MRTHPTDLQIRAAHAGIVEHMRRNGSLATPVPTTNDMMAVMHSWAIDCDRDALIARVCGLGLLLADHP
jgi:hypothetical protein